MDGALLAIVNRYKSMRPKESESSKKTCGVPMSAKSIRGTYNLPTKELEAHHDEIIRIEEKQALCDGCDGKTCKQTTRGIYPVVSEYNGFFHEAVAICKWEKKKREEEKIARLFHAAKVPAAYEHDGWDNYKSTKDNERAVAAAKWIVLNPDNKRGLFIYGPRGTGKTMLAAIIANEKAKKGQPVLFTSVPDLLEDIRMSFGTNQRGDVMQAARDTPCLVLDDLGAERITEWVGEQLFTLLNYRYNERLQTIITTNYSTDELSERLVTRSKDGIEDDTNAQRILSRIYGMCARVYLGGVDWRQEKEEAW